MISREQIEKDSGLAKSLHARVHATFVLRDQSQKHRIAWSDACSKFHAQTYCFDIFETAGFGAGLRRSERDHIEAAILFLEVDPWFHRSGYLKEKLIRGVKQADLKDADLRRIRGIIWNVVHGPNRREFSDYCRLALVVSSEDFRIALAGLPESTNRDAKGKVAYLLGYFKRHSD